MNHNHLEFEFTISSKATIVHDYHAETGMNKKYITITDNSHFVAYQIWAHDAIMLNGKKRVVMPISQEHFSNMVENFNERYPNEMYKPTCVLRVNGEVYFLTVDDIIGKGSLTHDHDDADDENCLCDATTTPIIGGNKLTLICENNITDTSNGKNGSRIDLVPDYTDEVDVNINLSALPYYDIDYIGDERARGLRTHYETKNLLDEDNHPFGKKSCFKKVNDKIHKKTNNYFINGRSSLMRDISVNAKHGQPNRSYNFIMRDNVKIINTASNVVLFVKDPKMITAYQDWTKSTRSLHNSKRILHKITANELVTCVERVNDYLDSNTKPYFEFTPTVYFEIEGKKYISVLQKICSNTSTKVINSYLGKDVKSKFTTNSENGLYLFLKRHSVADYVKSGIHTEMDLESTPGDTTKPIFMNIDPLTNGPSSLNTNEIRVLFMTLGYTLINKAHNFGLCNKYHLLGYKPPQQTNTEPDVVTVQRTLKTSKFSKQFNKKSLTYLPKKTPLNIKTRDGDRTSITPRFLEMPPVNSINGRTIYVKLKPNEKNERKYHFGFTNDFEPVSDNLAPSLQLYKNIEYTFDLSDTSNGPYQDSEGRTRSNFFSLSAVPNGFIFNDQSPNGVSFTTYTPSNFDNQIETTTIPNGTKGSFLKFTPKITTASGLGPVYYFNQGDYGSRAGSAPISTDTEVHNPGRLVVIPNVTPDNTPIPPDNIALAAGLGGGLGGAGVLGGLAWWFSKRRARVNLPPAAPPPANVLNPAYAENAANPAPVNEAAAAAPFNQQAVDEAADLGAAVTNTSDGLRLFDLSKRLRTNTSEALSDLGAPPAWDPPPPFSEKPPHQPNFDDVEQFGPEAHYGLPQSDGTYKSLAQSRAEEANPANRPFEENLATGGKDGGEYLDIDGLPGTNPTIPPSSDAEVVEQTYLTVEGVDGAEVVASADSAATAGTAGAAGDAAVDAADALVMPEQYLLLAGYGDREAVIAARARANIWPKEPPPPEVKFFNRDGAEFNPEAWSNYKVGDAMDAIKNSERFKSIVMDAEDRAFTVSNLQTKVGIDAVEASESGGAVTLRDYIAQSNGTPEALEYNFSPFNPARAEIDYPPKDVAELFEDSQDLSGSIVQLTGVNVTPEAMFSGQPLDYAISSIGKAGPKFFRTSDEQLINNLIKQNEAFLKTQANAGAASEEAVVDWNATTSFSGPPAVDPDAPPVPPRTYRPGACDLPGGIPGGIRGFNIRMRTGGEACIEDIGSGPSVETESALQEVQQVVTPIYGENAEEVIGLRPATLAEIDSGAPLYMAPPINRFTRSVNADGIPTVEAGGTITNNQQISEIIESGEIQVASDAGDGILQIGGEAMATQPLGMGYAFGANPTTLPLQTADGTTFYLTRTSDLGDIGVVGRINAGNLNFSGPLPRGMVSTPPNGEVVSGEIIMPSGETVAANSITAGEASEFITSAENVAGGMDALVNAGAGGLEDATIAAIEESASAATDITLSGAEISSLFSETAVDNFIASLPAGSTLNSLEEQAFKSAIEHATSQSSMAAAYSDSGDLSLKTIEENFQTALEGLGMDSENLVTAGEDFMSTIAGSATAASIDGNLGAALAKDLQDTVQLDGAVADAANTVESALNSSAAEAGIDNWVNNEVEIVSKDVINDALKDAQAAITPQSVTIELENATYAGDEITDAMVAARYQAELTSKTTELLPGKIADRITSLESDGIIGTTEAEGLLNMVNTQPEALTSAISDSVEGLMNSAVVEAEFQKVSTEALSSFNKTVESAVGEITGADAASNGFEEAINALTKQGVPEADATQAVVDAFNDASTNTVKKMMNETDQFLSDPVGAGGTIDVSDNTLAEQLNDMLQKELADETESALSSISIQVTSDSGELIEATIASGLDAGTSVAGIASSATSDIVASTGEEVTTSILDSILPFFGL